jgi:hypothetical protein
MENARDANPPESEQPRPKPPSVIGEIPSGIELINYVAECLELGCDPMDVRKQLQSFGQTAANAEKIVADTIAWRHKNPNAGKSSGEPTTDSGSMSIAVLVGCLVGLLGVMVTAISYVSTGRAEDTLVGLIVLAAGVLIFLWGRSQSRSAHIQRPLTAAESQSENTSQGTFSTIPHTIEQPAEKSASDETAIPEEVYTYALDQLVKGFKPPEIRRSLADAGYAPRQVDTIMECAMNYHKREGAQSIAATRAGIAGILPGCALVIIGIVITIGTMSMASSGGTYVVAWGAILTGAVWIFRAMNQRPQI